LNINISFNPLSYLPGTSPVRAPTIALQLLYTQRGVNRFTVVSKPLSKPSKSYSTTFSPAPKTPPPSMPHTLAEESTRQPRRPTQPPTRNSPSTCPQPAANRSRPSCPLLCPNTVCKRPSHSSTM
jgi:hypothetical protein